MHITGTVTGFDNKTVSPAGKRPFTVHILIVDGVPYECGYKKPAGIGPGDIVNFEYEVKYGNNQVQGGINKGTGGASPAPTAAPAAPAASSGGGRGGYGGVAKVFPVPVDHPDRSIIRQNALAHATRAVISQVCSDALTDEALAERIINMAYRFEDYATGHREVNALKNSE